VSCVVITWGFYTRRGGLLYEVERQLPASAAIRKAAVG
jgi:NNP family nitrate/nitrite transporter-like MFS transporter